jgi:hypothetical protein
VPFPGSVVTLEGFVARCNIRMVSEFKIIPFVAIYTRLIEITLLGVMSNSVGNALDENRLSSAYILIIMVEKWLTTHSPLGFIWRYLALSCGRVEVDRC